MDGNDDGGLDSAGTFEEIESMKKIYRCKILTDKSRGALR